MMADPEFPEVVVDLTDHEAKPVASVALVRRALQKAGHPEAAERFTAEAFAAPSDAVVAVAARFVTVSVP